jgi:hypothetical protein
MRFVTTTRTEVPSWRLFNSKAPLRPVTSMDTGAATPVHRQNVFLPGTNAPAVASVFLRNFGASSMYKSPASGCFPYQFEQVSPLSLAYAMKREKKPLYFI